MIILTSPAFHDSVTSSTHIGSQRACSYLQPAQLFYRYCRESRSWVYHRSHSAGYWGWRHWSQSSHYLLHHWRGQHGWSSGSGRQYRSGYTGQRCRLGDTEPQSTCCHGTPPFSLHGMYGKGTMETFPPLQVMAVDQPDSAGTIRSSTATIYVQVTDVNEHTPSFTNPIGM